MKNEQKILIDSPISRKVEETLRVAFMERTWNAIKNYGIQHLMTLGLNWLSKNF